MIEADDLRKAYDDVVAVDGVSFAVESGEIFGLIGPNGAGKTTTLKMLAGLLEPTDGAATVAGYDSRDREMRRSLGFLPEDSPLYEDMTARSYLRFFADLYDVPRDVADERIGSTLDRLDLDVRDRPLGNTSKGMKRKVAIARALVNDPDVLLFDEPASGLDPLTTNAIIEFVGELSEDRTVVFSAHNLYHVESLCDRVAILLDGEIVARGTIDEIRTDHGGVEYHVYTSVPVDGAQPVPAGSSQSAGTADPSSTERDEPRYLSVVDDMAAVDSIRRTVESNGGELLDVRTREPSLEDVFLDVAGA